MKCINARRQSLESILGTQRHELRDERSGIQYFQAYANPIVVLNLLESIRQLYWKRNSLLLFQYASVGIFETCSIEALCLSNWKKIPFSSHYIAEVVRTESVRINSESMRAFLVPDRVADSCTSLSPYLYR